MGLNSWLNVRPQLDVGETVRFEHQAGLTIGRGTVGGKLYVTTREVIYHPSRSTFPSLKEQATLRFPVDRVAAVGIHESAGTLYDGGVRRRVRMELTDGETYVFTITHAEKIAEELRDLIFGSEAPTATG